MHGEVKTYFLSPEELEEYRKPKKCYPHEGKKPLNTDFVNWEWPIHRKERERHRNGGILDD